MNAYSICGTHSVDSKKQKGEKVAYAALTACYEYNEKLETQALSPSTTGADAVDWLRQRDEDTRAAAIVYTRRGWPLGEALLQAYQDEKIDWKSGVAQITPASELHSHHNRGSKRMMSFVVQDEGLHWYLRTTGFSWD